MKVCCTGIGVVVDAVEDYLNFQNKIKYYEINNTINNLDNNFNSYAAYKYGAPVIVSTGAIIIFVSAVELFALFNTSIYMYLKGPDANRIYLQVGILGGGVLIFIISAIIAYKISVKRFEKVDI